MMLRFKDVAVPSGPPPETAIKPSELPQRLLVSLNPDPMSTASRSMSKWRYPGGEIGVRVGEDAWRDSGMYRIQNAEDLVAFIMGLDARQRMPPGISDVFIPYLPYARQDRVAVPGDPLAIHVLAGMLAGYGLKTVWSLDVHSAHAATHFSDLGIDLISVSPIKYIKAYIDKLKLGDYALVSPDAGAFAKTYEYLQRLPGARGMIVCRKVRDPVSGRLSLSEVSGFVPAGGRDLRKIDPKDLADVTPVIVDDICDGGRTFLNVASALREVGSAIKPHLWTSHGIYSNGLTKLLEVFETLGSTDSFLHAHCNDRLITVPLNG